MDKHRFQRIKELFQQAVARPTEQRAAFVEESCAGDPVLRGEVLDLLGHAAAAATFLDGTPGTPEPGLGPDAIPGFRLRERLAVGGSGTVWLAEQHEPRRQVAVKVLRVDSLGPGQVARFRREAEILAGLDHPGIARVIGAGLLGEGPVALPWIALEFVRGKRLDEHVAEQAPGLRALLALFVEVCDAVQHAHERGVVHRDLKPSNVLVDPSGRPRVLDFGVARTQGGEGVAVEHTRTGTVVGTLAYMPPEQARGERELAPSADVYALAVMLFELLTGHLPLALDELDLLEAVQVVGEDEPEPLRRTRPDLPHDLETIVGKALEKEPGRRYADAGALAADLRRFLAERPVVARRPTTLYQLGKLVRRNRALALATLAVIVALATGLAFALAALRRERAVQAFSAETLDAFATQMAGFAEQLGVGEEQRGAFEELVARIEQQLALGGESRLLRAGRARMLYELAALDQSAGRFAEMDARLVQAQAALEELTAEDAGDLASWTLLSSVLARRGEAARAQGDLVARDRWFAQALELDERLVREHPGDAELIEDLGWSLERIAIALAEAGRFEESKAMHVRRLADAEELVRREPDQWKYVYNLSKAYNCQTGILYRAGRLDVALTSAQACVEAARRYVELQPGRRSAILWLAQALREASQIAAEVGSSEFAHLAAVEAFGLAEGLVFGDPAREEHPFILEWAGRELAARERELGRDEELRRMAERLSHLVDWLGPKARSSDLQRLIDDLESWTR